MNRYAGCLVLALSATTTAAEDWPQWQGPNRDAVSKEKGLLQEWPTDGPTLAWKVNGIGAGMGGIAVSKGHIFTTGDIGDTAWLFALKESDGKEVWKAKIGKSGKYGNVFRPSGPRATPTVEGDRIYILGQHGDLVCFSTEGKDLWRVEYVKELKGINPVWGFSESVLIDGDKLVCTPGTEDGTVMALDKKTGKPIWKCKVPEGPTGNRGFLGTSGAAYSSVIAVDVDGLKHYVQLTATTMVGVSTEGKLLWRYDRASNTHRINCSTPVYHDGMVFAASSYDAGGGAVKLSKGDKGAITAKEVYFSNKLKNHHGGFVVVDGYLYGSFDPGILTCLEFKTGKVMWESRGPGKGSITYADGRLYCRNEGREGAVYLVEANPKEYVERGRFNQPERTREQAWTHPVIANGKMYIRDQGLLLCYDVKAK
ncbi:MAG TPA: PQQ-binding-like beta-propeller repeat protein [Gemmata sp.]|nr:PQQ-binding-like beta-propeller repeat protein [Gemmata sp.]